MSYHYDPSWAALLTPARNAVFFAKGRPADEPALCAELSRLAYAPFERDADARQTVQAALQRGGFSPAHLFSTEGTQGLLASATDGLISVLAFRGTEVDPGDWATDLRAWMTPWPNSGRVHQGFAAALAAVWRDLEPLLGAMPGRRLYMGHSLGAALAVLAASRQPPDALYVYGCPRVGDDEFVRSLAGVESHRYTNCCDAVCGLPPETLGYRHLGPPLYLDREGALHPSPANPAVRRDQWLGRLQYTRRWAWRLGTPLTRNLPDHAPVNYFSALSGLR